MPTLSRIKVNFPATTLKKLSVLRPPRLGAWTAANLMLALLSLGIVSCRPRAPRSTASAASSASDSAPLLTPDLTLTDQNGNPVNLAGLRGHPILVDFIYTSCPGPCEMMTDRMSRIADSLGPKLGNQVIFVSITIDPEHDRPAQLLAYSKRLRADRKGWLFLTGTTAQVLQVMKTFGLQRLREPDGSLDHELVIFLVGPNGKLSTEYAPSHAPPRTVVADIDRLLTGAQPQL